MKISGFTFCRNADKLYYPIKQCIESALPLVDEFIVLIGDCDSDDRTIDIVESIHSDKIKIHRSSWDLKKYSKGTVHAQQTDAAKSFCNGDWLLYLQADEVLHEKDLPLIKAACQNNLHENRVEGFVLNYHHFWADYQHVAHGHTWYNQEIRIIRNVSQIHSYQSAQSFRWIENFDGVSYRKSTNTRKLFVKQIAAHIYHYGWVRPPALMTSKTNALDEIHSHVKVRLNAPFDFGILSKYRFFDGSHPSIMKAWMANFDWQDQLNYSQKKPLNRYAMKHEKFKYRMLSWVEKYLLFERKIAAFKNFILLK